MTIVEALKADKIDRITVGNRRLYFTSQPGYGEEQDYFVVRESRRGPHSSVVLVITKSEDEAVEVLLNGRKDER